MFVHPGVAVASGATVRLDAVLDLGEVTETVEVKTSTVDINVSNAEVSQVLGEKFYHDLPVVMGSDIRLAEALLAMQPGYGPMRPNGDPIFRGSLFQSRMNGGQTMAMENYLDGASFGSAIDHNNTQERSVPFDSVKETKVIESNFSAQYGRTSGGFVEYTTKSGTSAFHGSGYGYYNYQGLNATGELIPQKTPERKLNWGFTIGGPVVIPKVYDGRKHQTYFFANFDLLHFSQGTLPSFGSTNPLPAFLQGDFSSPLLLNTTTAVATDALGRPIYAGEIFNPATTRLVGGVPVRDGYGFDPVTGLPVAGQANIIPANDPLWSPLATAVIPNIPALDRNTLKVNGFGGSSDDNNKINVRTWLLRFDHAFSDKFTINNTYYENIRPRIAHCGGPQGCTTVNNGETDSKANNTYIGQGFYQRITNHFDHLQMNWVIKPNLFNHTTVAYDRWQMLGHQLS